MPDLRTSDLGQTHLHMGASSDGIALDHDSHNSRASQFTFPRPELTVKVGPHDLSEQRLSCAEIVPYRPNLENRMMGLQEQEFQVWKPTNDASQHHIRCPFDKHLRNEQSSLLPAAEIATSGLASSDVEFHLPCQIERPRSALHAGDFTDSTPKRADCAADAESSPKVPLRLSTSLWPGQSLDYDEVAPWMTKHGVARPSHRRVMSNSSFSASSYVLKAPTTPLVQQQNNCDIVPPRDRSASPVKDHRRRTHSPHSIRHWSHSQSLQRHDTATPSHDYYRTIHQSSSTGGRRSNWSLQQFSPPSPTADRSRCISLASDTSPRLQASMVGSYEESLLRGRMSTAPSQPFNFTAHIGVLGSGKRPKIPAHVTVPFQAVYYDWPLSDARHSSLNEEPSPYVGQINLQNIEKAASSRGPGRASYPQSHYHVSSNQGASLDAPNRQSSIQSTNPITTKLPSGGCYRIPLKGQIQVVIKNPYKTALKLFLVPYDLTDMEEGQKTFVRQRYHSSGPILEHAIASAGQHLSTPTSSGARAMKKPILRYLIHLNICCPSRGRYYLYQQIRVVFANRVPDDKEHLTKDLQEPLPKFTPWKMQSDMRTMGLGMSPRSMSREIKQMNISISRPKSMSFVYPSIYGGSPQELSPNLSPLSASPSDNSLPRSRTRATFGITYDTSPVSSIPFRLPIQGNPSMKLLSNGETRSSECTFSPRSTTSLHGDDAGYNKSDEQVDNVMQLDHKEPSALSEMLTENTPTRLMRDFGRRALTPDISTTASLITQKFKALEEC